MWPVTRTISVVIQQDSIALKLNVIIVKAFNLYQQRSSPALHIEWDNIVDEICFTKDLLNVKGVQSTVEWPDRPLSFLIVWTRCSLRAHLATSF